MKYIGILSLVIAIIINGCSKETSVNKKPPIITKEQRSVIFTEYVDIRYNNKKYMYLIDTLAGTQTSFGKTDCLKTFDIELGKTYMVDIRSVDDILELPEDLCTMTALLKNSSMK